MAAYDIVIRNGQVADGTGKKLFAADVALKGDRIVALEVRVIAAKGFFKSARGAPSLAPGMT